MKLELDVTGKELVLLYIITGNEDAGRILLEAIREDNRLNPPAKKVRKSYTRRAQGGCDGK